VAFPVALGGFVVARLSGLLRLVLRTPPRPEIAVSYENIRKIAVDTYETFRILTPSNPKL
jgi:hypothetical protein